MKKKLIIIASAALLFCGGAMVTSCGNQEQSDTHESHEGHDHEGHDHDGDEAQASTYSCPMKCEGEKTYAEAGKCGACGMDLEAVAANDDHEGHSH
ncbi:MAG TPA: hypothetical protein DCX14_04585 [Flavobacteriales bacterium]|jgi:hypothetical protein|nr:hypothetical protein [Flavobacteriales bacterium]HAW19440.1 hypothetical protein [Flavobacteriales bacterium]